MTSQLLRSISLAAAAFGAMALSAAPADAQTRVPEKESELVGAGHKPLSGEQISTMLVGNTAYFLIVSPFGAARVGTVLPSYYRDVRVRVRKTPDGKKAEGNWWTEGNVGCSELVGQGHVCFSYYKADATIYVCRQPEGACYMTVRVIPGNPENL